MAFDEDTIYLYTNGSCYLLAYYLQKKIDGSDIYMLEHNGVVIHSLVYHNNHFYDICNKFKSEDDVIAFYTKYFGVEHNMKLRRMHNESELSLCNFHKMDHVGTMRLVNNYFNELMRT